MHNSVLFLFCASGVSNCLIMCAPPIQRGGFRLCPPSFPPSLFGVPMQSVMWCRPTPNRDPSHPHRPCNAQTVILSATKSPLSATQLRQIRVNVLSPHSPTSQSNSPNKDFLSPKYLSAAKRSVRQVHKIWLKWGFLSQIWFSRPQYFAQVLQLKGIIFLFGVVSMIIFIVV